MFLVLYIVDATILHAHALTTFVAHFALMGACIATMRCATATPTEYAVSGTLIGITAVVLYVAFYYTGYARCQAYLLRVQAVQTKSGAAAYTINHSFIRQVLHDFG